MQSSVISSPNEESMYYTIAALQRLTHLSPECPGRPSARSFFLFI